MCQIIESVVLKFLDGVCNPLSCIVDLHMYLFHCNYVCSSLKALIQHSYYSYGVCVVPCLIHHPIYGCKPFKYAIPCKVEAI